MQKHNTYRTIITI